MSTVERRQAFLVQHGKDFGDAHFDPELDLVVYRGQHTIRESLWHALGLLNEGRSRVASPGLQDRP